MASGRPPGLTSSLEMVRNWSSEKIPRGCSGLRRWAAEEEAPLLMLLRDIPTEIGQAHCSPPSSLAAVAFSRPPGRLRTRLLKISGGHMARAQAASPAELLARAARPGPARRGVTAARGARGDLGSNPPDARGKMHRAEQGDEEGKTPWRRGGGTRAPESAPSP